MCDYRKAEWLYAEALIADYRGEHKRAEGLRLRAYNLTQTPNTGATQ